MKKRVSNTLYAVLGALALVGCSSASEPRTIRIANEITVTPATLTLSAGEHGALAARAYDGDGNLVGVRWTSSNLAVSTVTDSGVVTGVGAGLSTIVATSSTNAAVQAGALATVR
jgi:uncharacterized protein YjdB